VKTTRMNNFQNCQVSINFWFTY